MKVATARGRVKGTARGLKENIQSLLPKTQEPFAARLAGSVLLMPEGRPKLRQVATGLMAAP
jgi:hypothetical protein